MDFFVALIKFVSFFIWCLINNIFFQFHESLLKGKTKFELFSQKSEKKLFSWGSSISLLLYVFDV